MTTMQMEFLEAIATVMELDDEKEYPQFRMKSPMPDVPEFRLVKSVDMLAWRWRNLQESMKMLKANLGMKQQASLPLIIDLGLGETLVDPKTEFEGSVEVGIDPQGKVRLIEKGTRIRTRKVKNIREAKLAQASIAMVTISVVQVLLNRAISRLPDG